MPHVSPPRLALTLALPLAFGCNGPSPATTADSQAEGEAVSTNPEAAKPAIAKISKVRGSRGLSSPDLPEGAFLGEGAGVAADQWIELPRGTRVELALESGGRLRIDEDSRLRIRAGADAEASPVQVELERGRMVVLAEASTIEVLAADDRLLVERGEAELHHAGETRHYGVVQGYAKLFTAQREIPLGPGASISTPAKADTRPDVPVDPNVLAAALVPNLSLAPLQEAAWTAAFDETSRLAADVPQGVGSLVAKRAGSQVERQSLRLTEQIVNVTISGRIARTEIEQAFHNDSSQTLEGIYQFPLPADASISDLQLLIGDEWMRGEMLEKQRAQQIFRQIVDATIPRDPALLQWEQGGVFKLNIFPIPGKGERRIKIAYTQVLPAVGQSLRYRYPMGGGGATATEIGDFQFKVVVDDAGLDASSLAEVSTPMAELQRREGGDELELSMQERDYQPTHELGVDIPLPREQRRVLAATHRDKDGQGYFMLTLRPDLELQAERKPVHYAFVLDRSHGTTPELWTAAEGMTKAMLATLEPDDRFTLLACDTACDRLEGGLRQGQESATLDEVSRFLDRQVLAGASDIGNMLVRAGESLSTGAAASGEVEQVVVYMGDGIPTSGALTPDELGAMTSGELASVRVQAVALGSRSDLLVLDNLVRESGGDLMRVDARDDLQNVARELRLRAQVPVARDLAVELPPGLTDVYPKSIPALRPGDTLTLVGKLAEGDAMMMRGDVRLHGRTGSNDASNEVDERFQVMLDAEYSKSGQGAVHAHLPRTWAQHEITHLTQTEGAAAKDRIIALSREYNVLSRFTALLVLENDRMYREFNVARRANDKDAWTGTPTAGENKDAKSKEAQPEAEAAPATTVPTDSSASAVPPAEPTPSPDINFDGAEAAGSDGFFGSFDREESRERAASSEAEFEPIEEDASDFDEGDAGLIGGSTKSSSTSSGSGRGTGGFSPPPPKSAPAPSSPKRNDEAKQEKAKKPSSQDPWLDDLAPGGGGWSGGGGGGWGDSSKDWQRWQPRMQIAEVSGPSSNDRIKIADLQRIRDANPSDRKAHRDLVRRAVRARDPNALAFAAAWAQADPDHAPALIAHADELAAAGDPLALRAYASAVEVDAFSTKQHQRMAEALALAGDFERSCSHRRALVSIDPQNGSFAAEYAECLAASGRVLEARAAIEQARVRVSSSDGKKALGKAEKALDRGVARGGFSTTSSSLHGSPDLRAELRWTVDENLDLAFVDRRGRRLSVMRPESVRVREERVGAERSEIMTMREVTGTVFIEVTRPETRNEDPVRATLTVKTATGRQTFSLVLQPGTRRVALTRWQ